MPFHDCSHLSLGSSSTDKSEPASQSQSSCSHFPPNPLNSQIFYTNARSLLPKIDALRGHSLACCPDIISVSESWLDSNISNVEIFIPGYTICRRDCNRHGGGLVMFIKDTLPILSVTLHSSIELMLVQVHLKQGPLLLGLLYRPPSADDSFFADVDSALACVPTSLFKSTILVGDFNIDLLADNLCPQSCLLSDTVAKYGLTQVLAEPTRVTDVTSTLIDHVYVYVSDTALLRSSHCEAPVASSDHCSCISLQWSQPHFRKHRGLVWKYSDANFEAACDELNDDPATPFSSSDVDLHWTQWRARFLSAMTRHIHSRHISTRKCLPWFSQHIRVLILNASVFSKKPKHLPPPMLDLLIVRPEKVVSALRSAKQNFFSNLSSIVKSPKQFWSVYRSLTPNRHRLPALMSNGSTMVESAQGMCDLFVSHFSSFFSITRLIVIMFPSSLPQGVSWP